jgi:pimeloyl-ACP methyl ester carboxylesterase
MPRRDDERRMSEPPEIRYAKSGDVSIAYTVTGAGPDLVIAPGFISHQEIGREEPGVVHFIDRLASFRRVIFFDKRGTGLSDPVDHAPTLEECVDDLGAVMDGAGSEQADILGVSEGGSMAALFSALHPARTRTLVLYGSYARMLEAPDYPCGVPAEGLARLMELAEGRWGDGVGLGAWAPSRRDDPVLREWWARLQRLAASPGMVKKIFALYPDIDIREALPTIRVPTRVLHRRDDRMINLEMGRYLADHIPGAELVVLEGADHFFNTGDVDALLDEIEEFLTGSRRGPDPDRVLATVLFTDLVDSTGSAAALGDRRWSDLLEAHDEHVRRQVTRFRGKVVKTTGDGALVTFDGPARAVRCAGAVVEAVRSLGLESRVGVHAGEIELRGDDVAGIAVHLASRVMDQAGAGEVLVSRTVVDLVAGSGLEFTDRGTHTLKGVPGEWQLFAVKD